MAIIESAADFTARLAELIGDRTDDIALHFVEDARDTFNSRNNTDTEDWKKKYEDNDKEWRKRYKDAFFSEPDPAFNTGSDNGGNDPPKPLTFESLFKNGEK